MIDIKLVERLRWRRNPSNTDAPDKDCHEAADEIERLHAEIESLRDQQISAVNGMLRAEQEAERLRDVLTWTEQNCPGKCAGVVRAALEAKP